MKPRKLVVIHCEQADRASVLSYLLELRLQVRCKQVEQLAAVGEHAADLLVIVNTSPDLVDYQPLVDEYCTSPALVWHQKQGATVGEFLDAVALLLLKKRGPKPDPHVYQRPKYASIPSTPTQTPAALSA